MAPGPLCHQHKVNHLFVGNKRCWSAGTSQEEHLWRVEDGRGPALYGRAGACTDPSPGLHLSITPLPPWSPFCAMCLTSLLFAPGAQTQSTVVPGESCCLLTPGCPLPYSHSQGPHPAAPGGDCGGFPPLSTSPGHSRARRQFQMSHNSGILWTGSRFQDFMATQCLPRALGDRVVCPGVISA